MLLFVPLVCHHYMSGTKHSICFSGDTVSYFSSLIRDSCDGRLNTLLRIRGASCFSFCSDSDDEEPVRKSKKSPKEKQKKSKSETPPKKDPVQYVSETGNGSISTDIHFIIYCHICLDGD